MYKTKQQVNQVKRVKEYIIASQPDFAKENSLLIEKTYESITLALISDKIPIGSSIQGLFIKTLGLALAQNILGTKSKK